MSSLMRRAVTEAHATSTNLAVESEMIELLAKTVDRLDNFQRRLTTHSLTRKLAMEAETLTGQVGFVHQYDRISSRRAHHIAMEGIVGSIFTAVGNAIKAVFTMIGKFLSWCFGGSSGGSYGGGGGGGGGQAIAKPAEVKKTVEKAEEVTDAAKKVEQTETVRETKKKMKNAKRGHASTTSHSSTSTPPTIHAPSAAQISKMSDKEQEEMAERMMGAVIAKSLKLYDQRYYLDIMFKGPYTQACIAFIKEFKYPNIVSEIEQMAAQAESIKDKWLDKAKALDDELMPKMQGADSNAVFHPHGALRPDRLRLDAFDKEIKAELDSIRDKLEHSPIFKGFNVRQSEIQDLWDEHCHGQPSEQEMTKIFERRETSGINPAELMKECRFVELADTVESSQASLEKLSERLMKVWDNYNEEVANRQEAEKDKQPVSSATTVVYRSYMWFMVEINNRMGTLGNSLTIMNMFYKALARLVSRDMDFMQNTIDVSFEIGKLAGEPPPEDFLKHVEDFKKKRAEFKHYMPA